MTDTLFLDVETFGQPHDGRLILVGWALNDGDVVVEENQTPRPSDFHSLLANPAVITSSHTLYDAGWFTKRGYTVAGPWHDTRVMAWCINENTPLDLQWLMQHYVGRDIIKPLVVRSNVVYFIYGGENPLHGEYPLETYDDWPEEVKAAFRDYNRRDVQDLRTLYVTLLKGLRETEQFAYWLEEEVPYTPLIIEMEKNGLPIDLPAAEKLAEELRGKRVESEAKLRRLARMPAGFNLNSPDQLAQYLFSRWFTLPDQLPMTMDPLPSDRDFEVTKVGRLWIHGHWVLRGRGLAPTPRTKRKDSDEEGKHPSTAAPELLYKHPNDPWIREYCLTYKKLDKLLSTYLDKFPKIAVETGQSSTESTSERSDRTATRAPVSSGTVGENEAQFQTPGGKGEPPAAPTVPQRVETGGVDPRVARSQPPVSTLLVPTTRLFGRFNQGGTVTGRLSSSDPNLQNIPTRHEYGKRIRELFIGRFVIGDYDALEMRIMAHFSGDPRLIEVFEKHQDPHALTAHALFGGDYGHDDEERNIGKHCNYGVGYGAEYKKLAQVLTLEGFTTDLATAKEYLTLMRGFYPRYYRWAEHTKFEAKHGGGINTLSGRRRRLKGAFEDVSSWKMFMYGERQAVNSEIQGSAADVIRCGMIAVAREVPELRVLAAVHDEAIWEYETHPTPETLDLVRHLMETPYDLRVPLIFEPLVCSSWAEKGEGSSAIELLEEEAKKI